MPIFKSNSWAIFKEVIIKILKIFIVFYSMAMTLIALDGFINSDAWNNKIAEYAIVYWNKILENWNVSPRLKARLDTAYELFKSKKVKKIIVSGWLWESWFEEAKIMKKYLLAKWMKIPWIIIDLEWNATMETSKNAFRINGERWKFPNVWVIGVSQFFHISRVKLSLKKVGFKYIWSASPDYFELRDIYSLMREVPAYIKYIFMWVTKNINIEKKDLKIIWEKIVEKLSDEELYKLNSALDLSEWNNITE